MVDKVMTNKKFAEEDQAFQKSCEKAGLPIAPMNLRHGGKTVRVEHAALGLGRQAGKWRRGCGLAYRKMVLKNL